VFGAITCENCGAKFRTSRDRCPRCRAVIVAPDPLAAAAKSRQLTRVASALVGLFLIGLATMWVTRGTGSEAAADRSTRPGVSRAVSQSPRSSAAAAPAVARGDSRTAFLDPSGAAVLAYNAGDYESALARFEEAVQKNPTDAESLSNLGQMLVKLGRTPEAIPHFERATTLNPQRWAYRFNLARALSVLGRWNESIASYQEAQRLFPDDYATTFNLALAFHKVGDEAAAVEQYRRAIELNPEDASFRLALAMCYDRLEKPAEAIAAYSEYLRLSPSGAEADKVRARVAELNGSDSAAPKPPGGGGLSQD
jgi:tetratricopeptide (TPR) repeat protein